MDKIEFISRLRDALARRGVPSDKADSYLTNLQKYLTPEDVATATEAEIEESADVCAAHLLKSADAPDHAEAVDESPAEAAAEPVIADAPADGETHDTRAFDRVHTDGSTAKVTDAPAEADMPTRQIDRITDSSADTSEAVDMPTRQIKRITDTPAEAPAKEDATVERGSSYNPIPDAGLYKRHEKATPRGRAMFALITVVSSPLWLIAGLIFAAPFIAMFTAEIAVTAALVCLLAGGSAAGAAASLTGIVYGIIQMFSSSAVGLYEIGFGIIIGGISMICGILIYNGAVRFMPWLIRQTARLLKFAFSKVKPLLIEYKRRCEKL